METKRFRDRAEAGRVLAERMRKYAGRDDVVVLALPRGGVPVAYEVAKVLGAPLGVFVVRKLGVPGNEELAMGAIASGGLLVLDERLVRALGIDEAQLERAIDTELRELERREAAYGGGEQPELRGKTVVLVDDGLATGATMRAAALAVRRWIRSGSSLRCRSRRRRPATSSATSWTRSSAVSCRGRFEPSGCGTRTSRPRATTRCGSWSVWRPEEGRRRRERPSRAESPDRGLSGTLELRERARVLRFVQAHLAGARDLESGR
jgi:adenine/guanine phosphoribosyltransferase-like PRPP-binding protein